MTWPQKERILAVPRLVLQAAAQAQKAADYILGETKDQSIDEN